MTDLHVLRVFCAPGDTGGNRLGVILDGEQIPGEPDRQEVARELGFSETVFVDDLSDAVLDIYTPSTRLPFAGHPLVGTAWLLRREVHALELLRPAAGEVPTRQEGELSWISSPPSWATGRRTQQFGSAEEVDALPTPPLGEGWLYAWAWADEAVGEVRARGFPRRNDGIVEDEATGAAAITLTGELKRDLTIRQGIGSQILTRYLDPETVELGGRVVLDEVRRL
ncbi:PhzF family phenazine biosynthesis protein [Hamadaea sp. NPDC051192]|uniref:PhzF family phenazine biosynthesis protein n=1 Tax=Hamadaea sp. NPDC051192 TaxID=3154940 RepID=UPI003430386A